MQRNFKVDRKASRPGRLVLLFAAAAVMGAGSVAAQQTPNTSVTTVSPLTINGGGVPVPNVGQGARMFTIEELHQKGLDAAVQRADFEDARAEIYECYQNAYSARPNPERTLGYEQGAEAARRVTVTSNQAERATRDAQQLRIDAAQGKATQAQVEQGELARQAAVREMQKAMADVDEARAKAIDIQELVKNRVGIADWSHTIMSNATDRASRKNPLVPKEVEDLVLENIKTTQRHDDKGVTLLLVEGNIRNGGARRAQVPALSVTAADQFGFPLVTQTVAGNGRIDAGKSVPFTFPLKPAPENAARVAVAFAAVKGLHGLEPVSADPVCSGAPPLELNPNSSGAGSQSLPSARTMQLNAPSVRMPQTGPTAPGGASRGGLGGGGG